MFRDLPGMQLNCLAIIIWSIWSETGGWHGKRTTRKLLIFKNWKGKYLGIDCWTTTLLSRLGYHQLKIVINIIAHARLLSHTIDLSIEKWYWARYWPRSFVCVVKKERTSQRFAWVEGETNRPGIIPTWCSIFPAICIIITNKSAWIW